MGIPGRGICLEIIADLGMARRDSVANIKKALIPRPTKILAEYTKGPPVQVLLDSHRTNASMVTS
jgi:hypothetical protein